MIKIFDSHLPMRLLILIFIFKIVSFTTVFAQNNEIIIERNLEWTVKNTVFPNGKEVSYFTFDGSLLRNIDPFPLPEYYESIPINPDQGTIKLDILEVVFSKADTLLINTTAISSELDLSASITHQAGHSFLNIHFVPLRFNIESQLFEKLDFIKLKVVIQPASPKKKLATRNSSASVLATGNWYKIRIAETGIYKIDYDLLKNMGINPDQIDPRKIQLFGNGGGMLPQPNSAQRPNDLSENSIYVFGEADGKFDKSDYILFFGQGPHVWYYDQNDKIYKHVFNYYSDYAFYFLTVGQNTGLRIQNKEILTENPDIVTTTYNYITFHEKVYRTEVSDYVKSGRDWFGEEFSVTTKQEFTFSIPEISLSSPVRFISSVAGRSAATNYFSINVAGNSFTQKMLGVYTSDYLAEYCYPVTNIFSFLPTSGTIKFSYSYQKNESTSAGWLNYITLNARANLLINSGQFSFRDTSALHSGIIEYRITSSKSEISIWDVSDINNPISIKKVKDGNQYYFRSDEDTLRQYIAFVSGGEKIPVFVEKIKNQNLHAIENVDMIIVTKALFYEAAKKLADHRAQNDHLNVQIVLIDDIYNEFSSGAQDVTAIRDFVRFVYLKDSVPEKNLKYLLLFGNASYDYRNILPSNTNFIPTYQSLRIYSPINSYASDDYFSFLDDEEGDWENVSSFDDKMDISVGRIPVSTLSEAHDVVDKIINYSSNKSFGDWRNKVLFVSDDVDDSGLNAHFTHSEYLSDYLSKNVKNVNVEKIYMDAYVQVSGSNGHKYPDAQAAINEQMQKGVLIVNYIGHGGEVGWAHERVLEISDINSWTNFDKLPVFITATCEFSRYDDPERVSAGQHVLLNPNGGGVALLTTSRVVYISGNETLTSNMFKDNLFEKTGNRYKTLGEILITTKNRTGSDPNTRKFILLGDPSMQIAIPELNVITTSLPDTLKALEEVTIAGEIQDISGNVLTDFNGTLCPTIFDKATLMKTLDNDNKGLSLPFTLMKNVIYKGKSSIDSGNFTFSFIVPKDISYAEGNGKISYYAYNTQMDACGNDMDIIVGGTSSEAIADYTPPVIKLYIGDTNFINGGITDENPLLLAKVYDENGINTTGNGVGHEILCFLDSDAPVIINDYYQSLLNSYQYGEIRFPFQSLSEGEHTVSIKVWDVANNSAEASLTFYVKSSDEPTIRNIFNFPNPFTQETYFSFEHNFGSDVINVRIDIFDIMGSLVRTIEQDIVSEGPRISTISWNPSFDYGVTYKSGLFVYRITLTNDSGQIIQGTGKMNYIK